MTSPSNEHTTMLAETLDLVVRERDRLRARVLELEQKSQRFDRELAKAIEIDEATNNERETELNTLKQQLATMTQERDELFWRKAWLALNHDSGKQMDELKAQLQAREATITELIWAMDALLSNTKHGEAFIHAVTCSASRQEPVGNDMCSCPIGQHIKQQRATIVQLEAHLKGHTDRALIVLNQFHAVCAEKQAQDDMITRLADKLIEECTCRYQAMYAGSPYTPNLWKERLEQDGTYKLARQARGEKGEIL